MIRRFVAAALWCALGFRAATAACPDTTHGMFQRGDVDGNGHLNVSDAIWILHSLFESGAVKLPCLDAADADDSGNVDIADAVRLLGWLFLWSSWPQQPRIACHGDSTPDALDCKSYPACTDYLGWFIVGGTESIVFILDRSATMLDQGELKLATQAATLTLCGLNESQEAAVLFFDKGVLRFPAAGPPIVATASNVLILTEFIESTPGGVGTCPQSALIQSLDLLDLSAKSPEARRDILYFSDGGGECPGQNEGQYLRETLTAVRQRNTKGVRIHTVGVLGLDPQGQAFLRDLAEQNGGTFVRITR